MLTCRSEKYTKPRRGWVFVNVTDFKCFPSFQLFHVLFHSLSKVLLIFPSWYLFAICQYLALDGVHHPSLESEDEVEQQLLIHLAKEGEVKFLDLLLAKAVLPTDLESPNTSNIREWTYKDTLRIPTTDKEEWKHAELESLCRQRVYWLNHWKAGRSLKTNV